MSQETVITPPSPELLSPHQRSEALKTRLAIGKDALEVDNKTVIKVVSVKELRDSFEKTRENTESRIAKASVGKRMEYWQKQGVKEKPEQMKKWKQDVAGLCHSQENQDKIDTLSSRHIGAVDWKNITDEQIGQLHEKYFGSSVSQKVTLQRSDGTALQIPAGTSDFINEVIMSYTNTDGTIDYASLQKDRASLEFMAGIFGIDKLLFEYIDVVTTLKDEQRTHALIALANQDIPSPLDVTKQTTRINSLNSYEEEQLRPLSEGYEVKEQKLPVVVEPAPDQTRPTIHPALVEKPVAKVVTQPQTKPVEVKPLPVQIKTPDWVQETRRRIDEGRRVKLKTTTLTPELAFAINPELLKTHLLETLHQKHPIAYIAWEKLEAAGKVGLSDLELIQNSWTGFAHDKGRGIKLGIRPIPPNLKKQIIFENITKSYIDELLYRLSHEICHKLKAHISTVTNHKSGLNQLFDMCINMRETHLDVGLSALGSAPNYRIENARVQAEEDMAELMNMWIQNPQYLRRFLTYMSNPQTMAERRRVGLMDLEPQAADIIYETIEYELSSFLSGTTVPKPTTRLQTPSPSPKPSTTPLSQAEKPLKLPAAPKQPTTSVITTAPKIIFGAPEETPLKVTIPDEKDLLQLTPRDFDNSPIVVSYENNLARARDFIRTLDEARATAQLDPNDNRFLINKYNFRFESNPPHWYDVLSAVTNPGSRYGLPIMIYTPGNHANLILKVFKSPDGQYKMIYWDPMSTGDKGKNLSPVRVETLNNEVSKLITIVGENRTESEKILQANHIYENDMVISHNDYDLAIAGDRELADPVIAAKIGAFQTDDARNCVPLCVYAAVLRQAAKYTKTNHPWYLDAFFERGLDQFTQDFGIPVATREQLEKKS